MNNGKQVMIGGVIHIADTPAQVMSKELMLSVVLVMMVLYVVWFITTEKADE